MRHNSIHRVLATRLAVTAVCIAFILMAGVFWLELRNLDLRVQNQAAAALERLRWAIMNELDAEGLGNRSQIQHMLEKAAASGNRQVQSSFAYVRILDLDLREVAQIIDPSFIRILPSIDQMPSNMDKKGTPPALWHRMTTINGTVFIQLGKVINNSKGQPAAYVEGVYAISPAYIRKARYDAAMSALLAAGIVFITTLILYPTIIQLLTRVAGLSAGLVHANLDILSVLGSAIAKRDSGTGIHNCRVTLYAIHVGREMGLEDKEMRSLIKGAFLHDVGKIGIRDSVLLKPGSLTPEEFEETKQHVRHGLDIVRRSAWLADAAPVIGSHHEKYDGSGYLEGRKGRDIPLVARIFAVADVFDALTAKRPYKDTMGCGEALAMIAADSGIHFDPDIMDVFIKIAPELYTRYGAMDDKALKNSMIQLGAGYFLSNDEASLS